MDSDDNSIPNRHRRWIVAAVATAIAVTAAGVGWYLLADRNANSSMTARAGQVMPFDLNRPSTPSPRPTLAASRPSWSTTPPTPPTSP